MAQNLQGKTALVTGASSGIGLAVSEYFATRGARVALVSRREAELLKVKASIGDNATARQLDVSNPDAVAAVVKAIWNELEGIDYVVHAAGVVTPSALDNLGDDLWNTTISTNLSGAFYVMREVGLRMRDRGQGSIVAIGSDLAFKGMANYAHYCASKAGLAGLVKAMAMELAPLVRVNCVCPGPVDTPMMTAEMEWFGGVDATRTTFEATVPLKRFASSAEIAKFAGFIAVDATFATGSILSTDGGTTAS